MKDFVTTSSKTPYLIVAAVLAFLSYRLVKTFQADAKIRKLGARAPTRRGWAPLGLDLAWEAVRNAMNNTTYEMWLNMFNQTCGPDQYTIEAGVGERVILTAEPENIKAILATQFKDYGKGEQFRMDFRDFLGDGIFATDGHLWHNSRQLIRPQFTKDRLSDIKIFEEHCQILFNKMRPGQEVDALDLMFKFTLDAATHFLFGESVGSLERSETAFADAFSNVQRVQSLIARVGPLNWIIPRKRMGFYDSLKIVNEFVAMFIDKALALSPKELEEKTNHDEGYTFLHAIAAYTRDRNVLRDQLVSILLAGRDTTACTLTWAIYHLSMDPKVTAKLRQEIVDRVGLDRTPTYEDLKSMKYLQHVLNETLRLYPVVPYNVRFSLKDTSLPVGGGKDGRQPIGILAGTPIGYSTLVMQRRADLYPPPESGFPAVDKFVPERWDGWFPNSWTYIPFNGGPRICIGQQFALMEMGYTLVRIFQKYETVENRMNGVEPGMRADVVLQPAKEVRVAFY